MKIMKILSLLLMCVMLFCGCLNNPTEDQIKQLQGKSQPILQEQTVDPVSTLDQHKVGTKKLVTYNTITAKVNRVIDGDTIEVMLDDQKKSIRLLLIDTPETVKPRTPIQPFGKDASNFVKELLTGKTVELEMQSTLDKYGRGLAYVYVDGKSVQEELLSRGLARIAYVYIKNAPHLDQYKADELKAKSQSIGVWSISNYVQNDGFHPEVISK